MRHKYSTSGLVLARTPLAEAGMLVTLLTPEFGLIRARAEGVRRSGAKLAPALQVWDESDLMLVRGKDGWRITGAVLGENRFATLPRSARLRASRAAGLLLRLTHGDAADTASPRLFVEFLSSLPGCAEDEADAAEILIALRMLAAFGVDAGPALPEGYEKDALAYALDHRVELIARINRGISASGL